MRLIGDVLLLKSVEGKNGDRYNTLLDKSTGNQFQLTTRGELVGVGVGDSLKLDISVDIFSWYKGERSGIAMVMTGGNIGKPA